MEDYWYFCLGFALVGILCLCPFIRLVRHATKIGGWDETYKKEEQKDWEPFKSLKKIEEFYSGDEAENYVGKKWLLEKKAYLMSNVGELEQKKGVAKDLIPLLVSSVLPEIISVFFLGMDDASLELKFIAAVALLALYSIAVIVIGFELVSIMLKSKTSDVIRDEYELKCIDRLIDRHFENV